MSKEELLKRRKDVIADNYKGICKKRIRSISSKEIEGRFKIAIRLTCYKRINESGWSLKKLNKVKVGNK